MDKTMDNVRIEIGFLRFSKLNKILVNHNEVTKSETPISFLNTINQFPGLGISFIMLGKNKRIVKGNDKPNPINKSIEKISIKPPDNAKPIAVPTRGAVQGVANKVKNIPVIKSPK